MTRRTITIAELEECQAYVAELIVRFGDVYAPIFDRLEREISALRAKDDVVSRARRLLAARQQENAMA